MQWSLACFPVLKSIDWHVLFCFIWLSRANLDLHFMDHHSGQRKYKCPQCNYANNRKNTVQEHFRNVHQGVRRHVCPVCQKVKEVKGQGHFQWPSAMSVNFCTGYTVFADFATNQNLLGFYRFMQLLELHDMVLLLISLRLSYSSSYTFTYYSGRIDGYW